MRAPFDLVCSLPEEEGSSADGSDDDYRSEGEPPPALSLLAGGYVPLAAKNFEVP